MPQLRGNEPILGLNKGNLLWWYKKLWKIRGPPKALIFFWLVLKGNVISWDRLQKRGQQGSGFFYLCKEF
jgi:hypothetical protein